MFLLPPPPSRSILICDLDDISEVAGSIIGSPCYTIAVAVQWSYACVAYESEVSHGAISWHMVQPVFARINNSMYKLVTVLCDCGGVFNVYLSSCNII